MAQWRAAHQLVEFLPWFRLGGYLQFDAASNLALVDAIACSANGVPMKMQKDGTVEMNYPLHEALYIAEEVRKLPDGCTMRDGRKWRSTPFIIFHSPADYYVAAAARVETHARLIIGMQHPYASRMMLFQIQKIVDEHHKLLLRDYEHCGILIRFERGRAQIKQALRRKRGRSDTEYYHAAGDRRRPRGWVTFSRDREGLGNDVLLFEELLSRKATETEMHKFFVEHPAILMEARLGVPHSQEINFEEPKNQRPDFGFSSILGSLDGEIELLELKGPDEKLVTQGFHPGLTRKVHAAIDQVRDYEEAIRNPKNFDAIRRRLGFLPESSRLAVLVGRKPESAAARGTFERRRGQVDVEIVTYDEVFESQACQL